MAFDMMLSIHSNLGTSPILSTPYSFSFILDRSIGTPTVLMDILMIALQMILLEKNFNDINGCSCLIDSLQWITQNWNIHHYALQIAACLFSGFMTAAGVCLIIKANLVFLAGEGLYAAVSQWFDADFGSCKTYGDIVLVRIAIISSWLALGDIIGVREGTIISALLVGALVKRRLPKFSFIQFAAK